MVSLFVFVRFLSEDALWLGLAGLVLSVFTKVSAPLIPIWILSISTAFAVLLGKKIVKLRYLAVIPMAASFFFCNYLGDWLLLVPIFLYNVKCILNENLAPNSTDSYYRFRVVAILGCIGSLLCVFAKLRWGFTFCILSIMCHLFLTRMLRHTSENLQNKKLILTEAAFLAIIGVLVFGFSSNLFLSASFSALKWVYLQFIAPILVAGMYLVMLFLMLINWFFSLIIDGSFEGFDTAAMQGMMATLPIEMEEAETSGGHPWILLVIKLIGIVLFLLAAYTALRFAAQRKAEKIKETVPENQSTGILDSTSPRFVNSPVSFLDRSPEAGVRRAYLNFCKWYDNYVGTIKPDSTTRTLNRTAFEEQNETANELRALYLRARYTGNSGLTNEDARRANALAKMIIKAK